MKISRKIKKYKKWIGGGIVVAFIAGIVFLFSPDLRVKFYGVALKGALKLGFFEPEMPALAKVSSQKTTRYKAHHFLLKNRKGERVNVADLQGKVVFVNFWATWCLSCVIEMPSINTLYKTYKNNDEVVFMMVAINENFNEVKDFLKDKEFDFPVYHPLGKPPKEFQTRGIPHTLILDKNGKIVFSHVGLGNYDTEGFRNFFADLITE